MSQAIISLVTAAAVLMHTLLCCSAHCVCNPQDCCSACEGCHEPALELPRATPWLEGDYAGFACRHHGEISPACCCDHHRPAPKPCHEHHKCACVLAASLASNGPRDINAKHLALALPVSPLDAVLTAAAQPCWRGPSGLSPPRYGSLRPHLALAVLLI